MSNNHIKILSALICMMMTLCYSAKAQQQRVQAINDYVLFTNENIHGMLIIHRILENLNQEVNKYVDLQSNQLNFYGNKDLPLDIFEDPEGWFYDESPNKIKQRFTDHQEAFSPETIKTLNGLVFEMTEITTAANSIRFEMEKLIKKTDLSQSDNQITIYNKLEACEYLYDRFYETKENLSLYLDGLIKKEKESLKSNDFQSIANRFQNIQKNMKAFLESWHFNIAIENKSILIKIEEDISYLKSRSISNSYFNSSISAADEAVQTIKKFQSNSTVPEKYNLYGKNYYFYNVELLSCLNKYGKGFTNNANRFLKMTDPNAFFNYEEPHFFKVIYPKKEIDIPEKENIIKALPNKLEERKVVVKQQTIEVKEEKLYLEIFDHKQEDGDIVSLNFNGKWILREKEIEKRPFKFVVELNTKGENYLLLHAVNLGEIPPNTIAVRYYLDGRPKLVVLNSDLDQSEMIRIKMLNED